MATTRHIVEEELGVSDAASLISAAIQILTNETFHGSPIPDEKVIHLTWKAKHMIDSNQDKLNQFPIYEQQNIIKMYLEGKPVSSYLKQMRQMETAFQF